MLPVKGANWALEALLLVVPCITILCIINPSFSLIYLQNEISCCYPSVIWKITAHQWYWEHEIVYDLALSNL